MAELAIKIGSNGPSPTQYQDGDIVAAFNRRRIRCTHAQHICDVRKVGFTRDGLRPVGNVAQDWFEHVAKYKIERLTRKSWRRTEIGTGRSVVVSNAPTLVDGKMIAADVEQFFSRQVKHSGHHVFGSIGSEIYYCGHRDLSHVAMDKVWNSIETRTAFREIDHLAWPMSVPRANGDGGDDGKGFLWVAVDDFDDVETGRLVDTEQDETDPENPILIKKRARFVAWRDGLSLSARSKTDLDDKALYVDKRDRSTFTRATVVQQKVRG